MCKVDAREIQRELLYFIKGGYDVLLCNFFFGHNECDVLRITQTDFVIEYEIKISRSDFFADFKKKSFSGNKHDDMKSGRKSPNRFFFVVPEGLVKAEEVPAHAGLIYYNRRFSIVKSAKLLHRNKFTDYRDICRTLASRDEGQRKRIVQIRNTDFDKEMAKMKREVESMKLNLRQVSHENFLMKHQLRDKSKTPNQ